MRLCTDATLAFGSVVTTEKRSPCRTHAMRKMRCPASRNACHDNDETDRRAAFQAVAPQTEAGLYLVPKVIE